MTETVEWRADGTPRNPRFDDIYRSSSGGRAQARHVFLAGCDLPRLWAGQSQWRVLETGFGLGINFLATWQAWKEDPQRPRLLHYVSVEAWPVAAADLLRSAADDPAMAELARTLAAQWQGLLPGFHRLVFEGGRVLLTLCIGDVKPMLREHRFTADSVFLDGFKPEHNPDMWDVHTLKAVARLCRRGTRVATWSVARSVRDTLQQCGFVAERVEGLAPKFHCLRAEYNPHWQTRNAPAEQPVSATTCIVIGAGVAGACVAASLARRGWQVKVLDRASEPAAGASGLPAGMFAPHVSPDDAPLARVTRAGLRAVRQQLQALLPEGRDWQSSGVLEHRVKGGHELPVDWPVAGQFWSREATPLDRTLAGVNANASALLHAAAGWLKPAKLVRALLNQPGIEWQRGSDVARLQFQPEGWQALDAEGSCLAQAALVVVAAGHDSGPLLGGAFPLQALRGQLALGHWPADGGAPPSLPSNGHGSLVPLVPEGTGYRWVLGATFERDSTSSLVQPQDHAANLARLEVLAPRVAARLQPMFEAGQVQGWAGVRATLPDRLPAIGPLNGGALPGVWACTGMGARGLTLAVLCGELLAAQLHQEPLPLERSLARMLAAGRFGETPVTARTDD